MHGLSALQAEQGVGCYANSTSIFLVSGSSLVILKLRIWPSLSASGFAWAAGELPSQRAFSIDERLDISGLASALALDFDFDAAVAEAAKRSALGPVTMWQTARMPSPSSTWMRVGDCPMTRPETGIGR